jgi:hypothetical protein
VAWRDEKSQKDGKVGRGATHHWKSQKSMPEAAWQGRTQRHVHVSRQKQKQKSTHEDPAALVCGHMAVCAPLWKQKQRQKQRQKVCRAHMHRKEQKEQRDWKRRRTY